MQNRFGFKDAVLILLAVAILVSVWLGITQVNRQWDRIQRIDARLEEQSQALAGLDERLRSGVAVSSSASNGNGDAESEDRTYFYRLMAPRNEPDYATGDWYVDAFRTSVGKLTPLVSTDVYQNTIESFVLEPLIKRDPDTLEFRPWIARDWQISEDGLTYSFDLREDVNFADGEPLTSEDVVFTYDLITDPAINAPRLQPYYENVVSVEAEGPYRVVFTMSEPYFKSLEISGGMEIMARHWYEKFSPEEINTMPGLLFGSGPYKLDVPHEEWESGTGQITLVRNDRYWGPRPTLERLVWKEIPDPTAQQVSFTNGEIDRFGVPSDQYDRLKDDEGLNEQGDLYRFESPASGYIYIAWNQRQGGEPTVFADVNVRRAMTMLINRQEMTEQIMSGLASVSTGPFHRLSGQSNPDIEPWPYDPERAKNLLADAGFADVDEDGVLEKPDGSDFAFAFTYPSDSPLYRQIALFIKDAFARAGITTELDSTEFNTMIQQINERNFEAISLGWGGVIESDPKQIFHSDAIEGGGDNYVHYVNEELDQLIDTARNTVDAEERRELWHEVHRILHEDQPYTFLYTRESVLFLDQRFRNVEITKVGLNDRTEYYVPLEEQRWGQ